MTTYYVIKKNAPVAVKKRRNDMKVKEFIEELQKFDQDKEVIINEYGKSLDFTIRELPLKDVVYLDVD